MLIFLAVIAGVIFNSGGWLAFWAFIALLRGHGLGLLLLIPLFMGLSGHPVLAASVLTALFVIDSLMTMKAKENLHRKKAIL